MRADAATLQAALSELEARSQRRRRRCVEAIGDADDPTWVRVDGAPARAFCSNDYLGLARHPALSAAAAQAMAAFGFGAGAAHLVSGHSREHQALEEELAAYTQRERALLFSTGYMANLGTLSALAGRHDRICADRLNHASLIDGAHLAGAQLQRYAHADAADAQQLLEQPHAGASLVVSDGLFSMDGDIAPLRALAQLSHQHAALLMVDDAHGLGVLGEHGGGALELAGLSAREVPVLIGTLGKAFGCFGAFVAAEAPMVEFLLQKARPYIYTTALPPAVAAAARAALRLSQQQPWRRTHLQHLVQRFRAGAARAGLPLTGAGSAIQPLIIGESARALSLSASLLAAGYWIGAIRPPTVPAGSARLRITLSAAHREEHIDALVTVLAEHWHALPA